MEYLRIENLSKSYGHKVLLDEVSLTLSAGDKVALIAKNGSGKSSLLKIISGQESGEGQDHKLLVNQNVRLGFLDQDPSFPNDFSILDALLSSNAPKIEALRAYQSAQNMGEDLHAVSQKMDDLRAWDTEARMHEVLAAVNLTETDKKVGALSGGQIKRLALAKFIIEDYDFLILDEPTNHLDLEMIEWLENYLLRSSLTLLMVTHDRYFLERVCNYMIELDRGRLQKFKGNYSDYLEKKALMTENQAVNLDKSKKLLKKELEWMRRQPKARGTKAKSRITDFQDLKSDVHTQSQGDEEMKIYLRGRRLGKKILEFWDTSFAYGDKAILSHFNYKFQPGEKLGIVGPNGAGKTTMVKLISGELKATTGRIVMGETIHMAHYKQDGLALDPNKRVVDVIQDIAEYLPLDNGKEIGAAQLLERFMFSREQQQVQVSRLSGGELKRLQLLSVLMENPNFLILDEPTNDLDILTLNVLEDFLKDFPGCLIIISHDRYFMDKLVDHLFVLDGKGHIKDFNGGYTRYRDTFGKGFDHHSPVEAKEPALEVKVETDSKKDYELRKEIKRIEKEIEKLEAEKLKLGEQLYDSGIEQDQMILISKRLKAIDQEIEEKEESWMSLTEEL